ncbi:maleylpyruvate isomerase N-terminal domain-containing protein [Nocardia sp. NPDC004654]|uniref:maleylpyruvate isomerase N-terminal domain-containing protein n=1 Tax=Nocardia sp. NPDC004654 TaxID=3154776 RepID=UPI0033A82D54
MAHVTDELNEVLDTLDTDEWLVPSACAGWRVRDVIAHLGSLACEVIEALPEPPHTPPMPDNRERRHDRQVIAAATGARPRSLTNFAPT